MSEPTDPVPNGLHVTRRLDHEPPPVAAQLGWRYHHVGIPTTVVHPGESHLEELGLHVSAGEPPRRAGGGEPRRLPAADFASLAAEAHG